MPAGDPDSSYRKDVTVAFQTPITIAKALERMRQNQYVLPAIQREFVWHHDQITTLFDSLMRGYPIGTFLFWEVEAERVGDFRFYQFLSRYHERDHRYTVPIDFIGGGGVTAVLDGQQRLTGLSIGLRGSYAYKIKWGRWSNPDAFPRRHLYLNLLRTARTATDVDIAYDFRFLTEAQVKGASENDYWFRVRDVLRWRDLNDVMTYLSEMTSTYLSEQPLWQSAYARKCLARLLEVIHTQPLINFYEETEQDIDKVLNIFIRVNSGGTVLSYSDLLLSIATATWETRDAREEIRNCVDGLNRIGRGFGFNKDLVLKACLVLSEVRDIGFKVRNFTRRNMNAIEQQWEAISNALYVAAKLLGHFGYDGHTLTARNVMIPVAYYALRRGLTEADVVRPGFRRDASEIRKWVRRALVKRGTFGAGLDTTLRTARTTIREGCVDGFSYEELDSAFARIGRPLRFEEEELEDLLDRKFGSRGAFSVLALLYPHVDFANQFHVDHIFPRAAFAAKRLREAGLDAEAVAACQDRRDRIANLQLLPGPENLAKSDKMPGAWMAGEEHDEDWRKRAYLGEIPGNMTGFLGFYEDRRERMKKRLARVLGVSLADGATEGVSG